MTDDPTKAAVPKGEEFAPGSSVDNFRIGKLLGEGGMGEVYLARDTILGRKVALKVIRPEVLGTPAAVERFFFEARVTASFNHPHIITVYAVGQHGGCPYLALEYLEGQTLRERLVDERMGHHEAARVALAIAQALEVAHDNGVLHRDLKPENIIIPRDGRLRVLDFGLAKAARKRMTTGSLSAVTPAGGVQSPKAKTEVPRRVTPALGTPRFDTLDAIESGPLGRIALDKTMGSGSPALTTTPLPAQRDAVTPTGMDKTLGPGDLHDVGLDKTLDPGDLHDAGLDKTLGPGDLHDAGLDKTLGPGDLHDAGLDKTIAPGDLPPAALDKTIAPGGTLPGLAADTVQSPAPVERFGVTAVGIPYRTVEGIVGTPHYMSPEQWLQKDCTPETDVWALGLILWELITGEQPLEKLNLGQIAAKIGRGKEPLVFEPPDGTPEELSDLVTRMLAQSQEDRPTAAQVARQLEQFLHGELPRDKRGRAPNPFRGLLPFQEEHSAFFHGRDAELDAFLERLRGEAVLPVVGPSGAGKSSFVMAGVIPRLRHQGAWRILRLRPGRHPFRTLATRLLSGEQRQSSLVQTMLSALTPAKLLARAVAAKTSQDGGPAEDAEPRPEGQPTADELAAELRARPGLLPMLLQKIAEESRSRVLLYVDQLEELYTLVEDEQERMEFMQLVCLGADDPEGPVRVLFTLRDDFLGRLAKGEVAREALSRVTVVRAPGEKALEDILTKPLAAVGYRYEDPALVQEMLAAVRGEPASLPLLQFTSSLLWEQRDGENHILTRAVFESVGGVAGALAHHADGVLQGLPPKELQLTRHLLLRLVTAEGTRVVLPVSEAVAGLGDGAASLLQRLVEARIVLIHKSVDGDESGAEIELIHESLLRNWERLRRWIDEGREDLAFLHEVGAAAALWTKRGKQDDAVWTGDALHDALRALDRCSTEVPADIVEFLEAGRRKQDHAHQLRRRRRLAIMISLSIVALASIIASLVFLEQKRQVRREKNRAETARQHADRQRRVAEDQRQRARSRWAEAQREGARAAAGRGDVLEARAKLRGALELQDSPLARALWWRLSRDPVVWKQSLGGLVYAVAFSPDCRRVAVAGQDAVVYLYDVNLRSMLALRGHEDQIFTLAWSPDGRRLASGSWDGQVRVRDVVTGQVTRLPKQPSSIWAVRFTPDGKHLVTSDARGRIVIWDSGSGRRIRELKGHRDRVRSLDFNRSGDRLASGGYDKRVILWDWKRGQPHQTLDDLGTMIYSVAFSPDGKRLVAGDQAGSVRIWKLGGQATLERRWKAHRGAVSLAFSPDGRRLASGGRDHIVRLWDVFTGRRLGELHGHTDGIYALDFSPDGRWLATGARDKTVRLWDSRRFTSTDEAAGGHVGGVHGVTFGAKDTIVVSGGGDRTARVWDVASGTVLRVIRGHTAGVRSVAISPDGRVLATGGYDQMIRLWDLKQGRQQAVLRGHGAPVYDLRFTPQGDRLVSTGGDGTLRLWSLRNRSLERTTRISKGATWSLAVAPSGKWIAAGTQSGIIRTLPLGPGRQRELRGHKASVYGLDISPDGRWLASGSVDRTLRLWDVRAGTHRVVGQHKDRVYRVAFHPDGQRVVSTGADGLARLWTLSGGAPRVFWGHRGELNGVSFSGHGRLLATASDDGTVRLWETDTGRPAWRAPTILLDPPALPTHRGWIHLDTAKSFTPTPKRWRRALQQRARHASFSSDGRWMCALDFEEAVERWDLAGDKRVYRKAVGDLRHVQAVPGGCYTLSAQTLRFWNAKGTPRVLIQQHATAMDWHAGRLTVAAGRALLTFDGHGKQVERVRKSDVGVTAIRQTRRGLVLGFRDGNIELLPEAVAKRRATFPFEGVPLSPVVSLLEGPQGTLVAGYANGLLGIWNLANGARFHAVRLHGPVLHLRVKGHRLYAATELGDHRTLDLSIFHLGYCKLLRQVWRATPALWEGGLPVLRRPPAGHRCNR
ncbi:MAG: protein kinase [bacterium]